MESLYAALGGERGTDSLVESMYSKVLADSELRPFFDGLDMVRQRAKFRAFLETVTGGPHHRSGIELRAAHSRSVQLGLTERHVEAFVAHFRAALVEANLDDELIRKAVARMEGTKADVLDR